MNTPVRRNERTSPASRFGWALLAGLLTVSVAACSADDGDPSKDTSGNGYAVAEKAMKTDVSTLIDSWANTVVAEVFNDFLAISGKQSEDAVRVRVSDSQSTKSAADQLCQELKTLQSAAADGSNGEAASSRIQAGVDYVNMSAEVGAAAALLRDTFVADPAEREKRLPATVFDEPSNQARMRTNLDALKKLGFLSPADEVLKPDPATIDAQLFLSDAGRLKFASDHFFVAVLQEKIKPCFPQISPG